MSLSTSWSLVGPRCSGSSAWSLYLRLRKKNPVGERPFLRAATFAGPLGLIAVEAGWFVTEVGRQPWIIAGVMRTAAAVTPMPGLVVPLLGFTLLYVFLGVIVGWYSLAITELGSRMFDRMYSLLCRRLRSPRLVGACDEPDAPLWPLLDRRVQQIHRVRHTGRALPDMHGREAGGDGSVHRRDRRVPRCRGPAEPIVYVWYPTAPEEEDGPVRHMLLAIPTYRARGISFRPCRSGRKRHSMNSCMPSTPRGWAAGIPFSRKGWRST